MTTVTTARRRLEHAQNTLELVEEHVDSTADSDALMQALGLLEQAVADLEMIESGDNE